MGQQLFHTLNKLATDRWARRGVRMLLRAAWLSVSIWCAGLGANLLWGWPLRTNILGALALAVIGTAVALLLRPRLKVYQAARRLDRRFHLDEQLATAIEVAATNPPPGSIAARLVAESSRTAELLQHRIARRQRPPWDDLLTLVLLGLVALGLSIIIGIGVPRLTAQPVPLPNPAEAQDPAQQLPQQPRAADQTQPSDQAQPDQVGADPAQAVAMGDPQILQALADALRDQGATRAAAQAIDRGDLADAARELRALADRAAQLSQPTRDALATNLRAAADTIGQRDPNLAERLNQSADGLARGGQAAAEALDNLARTIEQLPAATSDQGQPAGQSGQAGQAGQLPPNDQAAQPAGSGSSTGAGSGAGGEQRQADPASRLGVAGQPVPLDSVGAGTQPADASGSPAPGADAAQPGFTQGDASSADRVEAGADPLRIPIEERDVVQDYFRP